MKTLLVRINTKRFLRKNKIELFKGAWEDEVEVRKIISKYRPKAEIISIEELLQVKLIYPN